MGAGVNAGGGREQLPEIPRAVRELPRARSQTPLVAVPVCVCEMQRWGTRQDRDGVPSTSPTAPLPSPAAYQVTHRLNTTAVNAAAVEVLDPGARQYTATGLQPEATYLFRIAAQTRKGWGEAAEALVVTTEKRGNGGVIQPAAGGCGVPVACPRCSQPLASRRPPAAPREAAGAAGGGASPQRAALLGAGQRRALPRPLLHGAEPRAARRRVGAAFCLRQPQCHRLRGGEVRRGPDLAGAGVVMGAALGGDPVPQFPRPTASACSRVPCGRESGLWGHPLGPTIPIPLLCRLKPFTSYKFRVKATNDIGDSEYSEESESLTTLQAGQRGLQLLGQGERVPTRLGIPPCQLWSLTTHFSPPQPRRKPPPSSPSPRTPPPRCSSAGRYCPLRRGRWHRGVLGTASLGCRGVPGRSSPSVSSPRSPRPRTRSTGSCWVSASATGSWCTTACAASPCAASATPAPRGPSSPVSAGGPAEPGDAWLGG